MSDTAFQTCKFKRYGRWAWWLKSECAPENRATAPNSGRHSGRGAGRVGVGAGDDTGANQALVRLVAVLLV
jgi:hypothetical protein